MKIFGLAMASAMLMTVGAGCAATTDGSDVGATADAVVGPEEFAWATCGRGGEGGKINLLTKKDAAGKPVVIGLKGWVLDNPGGTVINHVGTSAKPFTVLVAKVGGEEAGDDAHFLVRSPVTRQVPNGGATFRMDQRVPVGRVVVNPDRGPSFETQGAFSSARITWPERNDTHFSISYLVEGEHTANATVAATGCTYQNQGLLRTLSNPAPAAAGTCPAPTSKEACEAAGCAFTVRAQGNGGDVCAPNS